MIRNFALVIFLFALGGAAFAQSPTGGVVYDGVATIDYSSDLTTIDQSSHRAVIDWRNFDVGRNHEVRFVQPNKNSATLNRVLNFSPSMIEGRISANGTVLIQNNAGVLLSGSAKVNAGGFVAASQILDQGQFMSTGNLSFSGGEIAGAQVANFGNITIGDAGLGALIGTDVSNAGVISAASGTILLASGEHTTIDITGDGMINVAVSGDSFDGSVRNSGVIDAGNGRVLLSAGGASNAMDGVINTSGIVRAGSGSIQISGRGDGTVQIGGVVSGSASRAGTIAISGQTVDIVDNAEITADGAANGGTVHIGGRAFGAAFEESGLKLAHDLRFHEDALVSAVGQTGTGGRVILWSENTTWVAGEIDVTGGTSGGFVETSGREHLGVASSAVVSAGETGNWLLDPGDVRIVNTVDGSDPTFQIAASTIVNSLNPAVMSQ
jgi:filamentous hemagglutinin family protein